MCCVYTRRTCIISSHIPKKYTDSEIFITGNGITGKIATLENEIAAFNEEKNALDAVHARTEAKYEKIQGQIAALMEERDEIERSMAENRGKVDMVNKNITGAEVSKKLLEQTRSLF